MPGWAGSAELLLASLRTTPPKKYEAAQRFYDTVLEVGQHVDVSEHCRILDSLMGPLREKAERDLRTAGEADGADEVAAIRDALPCMAYPAHVRNIIAGVTEALDAVAGAEVRAFGSAVNGFGDEASDVDLTVVATRDSLVRGLGLESRIGRRDLAMRALEELQRRLRERGFRVRECRLDARIPVLKIAAGFQLSGLPEEVECDLSVNNLLPMFNTALLRAYAGIDARAVAIARACKRWAKARGVHGAQLGHLSSYAFTLMVIFYMQVKRALPCLQQRAQVEPKVFKLWGREHNVAMVDLASMAWEPADEVRIRRWPTVAITFSGFVRFFCQEFRWGDWVVSVRTGRCLRKQDYPQLQARPKKGMADQELGELIHIEDPFDTQRDLSCVLDPTHNAKLRSALWQQHALDIQSRC